MCHRIRTKLDSYLDNELLTESNLEMLEHFAHCNSCTREAEDRGNMRRRLQKAALEIPVPAGLEQRVRDRLRQPKQHRPKKLSVMALARCSGVFRFRDPSGS